MHRFAAVLLDKQKQDHKTVVVKLRNTDKCEVSIDNMVDILRRSFVRDNQQKLKILKNHDNYDHIIDMLCARSLRCRRFLQ